MLAPAGGPNLAPDVVSNSWGDNNGSDITFLDDVRALRAANILSVFAGGNNGSNAGTISSPASFDESFAVGASDPNDAVAYFSSRGPSSLTGNIKPDITAPGVNVVSSVPGGNYGTMSGTSMATPHIAGVAALIRQAQPLISITETLFIITSTAAPLSTTLLNNDTGWGRVNAYAALMQVAARGMLSGHVVGDGLPLPDAQIVITDRFTRTVQTTTDAGGNYQIGLARGRYSVSIGAFGYGSQMNNSVIITTNQTTVLDADLARAPTATVRGIVTDLATGAPLTASVSAINTPVTATTDVAGAFSLVLPVGTYTLRAASWEHRVATATVTLTAGDVFTRDFALTSAPSILLVDSGKWYYDSQIQYYSSALDALGFLYHVHAITNSLTASPNVTMMTPYSITLWSSPQDSPEFVKAGGGIASYLDRGGRLLLSGQDIAFWDGGGTIIFAPTYFPSRLFAQFDTDNVPSPLVRGADGEVLT
ncbi:MAG: S8 family serine peptidase, partial [Chloroflexi bacterium]|nr:S8 family serine peptidase [Chloroflexota bacterium]